MKLFEILRQKIDNHHSKAVDQSHYLKEEIIDFNWDQRTNQRENDRPSEVLTNIAALNFRYRCFATSYSAARSQYLL